MNPIPYNKHFLAGIGIIGAYILAANILTFALPLLALEISDSGTGLALIKGAGVIPNILLAIFVGVINDRLRKATGFRLYSGLLAGSCAILWGLLANETISLPILAIFIMVLHGVGYAMINLQFTLIRLTVPDEKLADATALSSAVNATITTIGPAIAGFALITLGQTGLVGTISLLLILSFCAAFIIQPNEAAPKRNPFWPALTEGWHVFRRNTELVHMTIAVILTNAAYGALGTGIILKLKLQMGADDFQTGLVLAAAGAGAVAAATIAPRIRRRIGHRPAFYWPIWVLAALCLLIGMAHSFWILVILSFLDGAVSIFYNIGVWAYRQESTDAIHMGRIAGITGAIFKLLVPPIILLAGIFADTGNLWAIFSLCAILNILAALYLSFVGKWGWPEKA